MNFHLKMMDHVMTCLEEISGSGGSNSLRDKYDIIKYCQNEFIFRCFRCRNLDRNYFKRWLLRETPQEKMDIKLLHTFKKINTETAMRVHDSAKGLVPTAGSTLTATLSSNNLRSERKAGNVSELLAAKWVDEISKLNFFFFILVYQNIQYLI